jgi:hypothetical protein
VPKVLLKCGENYLETFSSVAKIKTVRPFACLAAFMGVEVPQVDVDSAIKTPILEKKGRKLTSNIMLNRINQLLRYNQFELECNLAR